MIFKVGQTLVPEQLGQREFSIRELIGVMKSQTVWLMSWAYREPIEVVKNKVFRFTVSGHHHKGYVYVILDWSDTFTVYYTDKKNLIKKKDDMVYIFDFMDILDSSIERIKEYVK